MARILVAEDEPNVRQILKSTIEDEGHTVIVASNGKNALNILLDNNDFELLISDIIMPEMDGRELVSNVRKIQALQKLPVVLISGFVPFNDIMAILELGTTRFLPKPIKNSDLINTVNDCLELGNHEN